LSLAVDAARPAGAAPKARGSWAADFTIRGGRAKVHKTGADLKLDGVLLAECLLWFAYHLMVLARAGWVRLTRPAGARIWFAPDVPRPWYLVWAAMAWGGMRIARSPGEAQAAFYFDDSTCAEPCPAPHARALNFACHDVSKSRVAQVFEAVFGYPLALDPTAWTGPAVEKGELNGVHDGRIVQCPHPRATGKTYQRLVDTRDGEVIHDLRTPCVGGRPVVVWIKRKPAADRFSIHNLSVEMADPAQVYSPQELEQIAAFCAAMGLDWGGLDILRDRESGRIYIVDVNKTDVGPVIALSWRAKLASTALLAKALAALVAEPAA
jgi:hypothetical protein